MAVGGGDERSSDVLEVLFEGTSAGSDTVVAVVAVVAVISGVDVSDDVVAADSDRGIELFEVDSCDDIVDDADSVKDAAASIRLP